MTTSWEIQQPVWRVSGLAEVVGQETHGRVEDAFVRFNRSGRTHTPPFLDGLSHTNQRRLDQWGYVVVPNVGTPDAAEELALSVGDLIPQYDGGLTHEVTYRPGIRHKAYSQSANTIQAHTEAPGWHPSPAYLALFCHRQARCGGGHTDLLDVRRLVAALEDDELALMTEHELHFPGPDGGVHSAMLSTDTAGDTVVRFSHNLLTTSDDDPALEVGVDSRRLPLGEAGRRLAYRVSELFAELRTSVLIPDGALLIWDNQRMLHARSEYADPARHLTQFWTGDWRRA